ncbi:MULTISPECIES: hypothetical protein [Acinetobacter]|nr:MULTISPECIES: hypothetical protein [Acinetobacter]
MRVFFVGLMMSSVLLLSACKDDQAQGDAQAPTPEPNCKMHCAP